MRVYQDQSWYATPPAEAFAMADDGDAMTSLSVPGKPVVKVPLIILRVHIPVRDLEHCLEKSLLRGRYLKRKNMLIHVKQRNGGSSFKKIQKHLNGQIRNTYTPVITVKHAGAGTSSSKRREWPSVLTGRG